MEDPYRPPGNYVKYQNYKCNLFQIRKHLPLFWFNFAEFNSVNFDLRAFKSGNNE